MPQYKKIDLARIQLEKAIDLCLREEDHICALTLAGAAEEVLSRLLIEQENRSAFQIERAGFQLVYRRYFQGDSGEKYFAESASRSRDQLQHPNRGQNEILSILDRDALNLIGRAIEDFHALTETLTPLMVEFWEKDLERGIPLEHI